MENHGTSFSKRWIILRERIEAMKAIWAEDEASYHGNFVDFDRIWSWPKPTRKPHPPILVGGNGERTLERVVRYGDEWMPLPRGDADWTPRIQELQELAAKAGRTPIPVTMFFAPPDPVKLRDLEIKGVTRSLFILPSAEADIVLPKLDELADLVAKFG